MSTSPSAMMVFSFSLLSLTSPLLSLIAQYLPIPEKLLLRRLSRTFPHLSPAAFSHSHVNLPGDVDGWIRRANGGASPLFPLLTHANIVSLRVKDWRWWPACPTPFDDPSPLLLFPRLYEVYLAVDSPALVENLQTLSTALVRSSPHLRSLSLHCYGPRLVPPNAFQPLQSLPCLTAVNLQSIFLHPSTFFFLCSLPLRWLNLSGAQNIRFDVDGVDPNSWLREIPSVSRSWQTLLLPQDECTATEVYEEIFRLYGGEGLQYLLPKGRPTAQLLNSIAAIASLTALDLSGFYNQQDLASDMSPFYESELTPRLVHLRHLVTLDWARLNMSSREHRHAFLLGCQQLVRAYGPQLHSLKIDVPCTVGERRQWLWHVISHCTHLRLLRLLLAPNGHELHRTDLTPTMAWPTAESAPSVEGDVALPHLHALWVEGCTWADVQLCVFTSHCSVLEDCRLRVTDITLESIALIGRLSPQLRRLSIESAGDSKDQTSSSISSSARPAASSSSVATEFVFPELRILSVSGLSASLKEAGAFAVLVRWLQRAPHFRLLRAHSDITVKEALALSSISLLRGLATSWCEHHLDGDIGRFFKPYKGWSTVRLFQQHWERWDTVESDEYMEDGVHIPQFVEEVDGKSGREAFFEWLTSLPPGWLEEHKLQRNEQMWGGFSL